MFSALDRLYTEPSQPIGLRLWRIGGDGRCLFRALAQGAHQLDKGKYKQQLAWYAGASAWYVEVLSDVLGFSHTVPGVTHAWHSRSLHTQVHGQKHVCAFSLGSAHMQASH